MDVRVSEHEDLTSDGTDAILSRDSKLYESIPQLEWTGGFLI